MAKQRFYIYADDARLAPIAWRLSLEGYDVAMNVRESWLRGALQGIVSPTSRMPRNNDIVLFASADMAMRDRLMQSNVVIGGLASDDYRSASELPRYAVEGWFNGSEFDPLLWQSSYSATRWLTDDLGPVSDGEWSVVWPLRDTDRALPALFQQYEQPLAASEYFGPVRVYCEIEENEAELETKCVCYDICASRLAAWTALTGQSLGEQLEALADEQSVSLARSNQLGMSLRLSVQPYPYAQQDLQAFAQPIAITLESVNSVWLQSVIQSLQSQQQLFACGDGLIGIAATSGAAENYGGAIQTLRQIASHVMTDSLQWRSDIASDVWECWRWLARRGYGQPTEMPDLLLSASPPLLASAIL